MGEIEQESILDTLRMTSSSEDLKSLQFWKAALAEFSGTLLLVTVGCGSCITVDPDTKPSTVQISLCFGLSVATVIWAIGHISGGHVNPAVTMGMLVTRKVSLVRAIIFMVAQCVGSIFGAVILKGLTPEDSRGILGVTRTTPGLSSARGFGVELVVTFVLVVTVCASCDKKRSDLHGSFPLTIGLSVTMCHLFAVPYTGSSMNPARSFGPAVAMGIWENHWLYWFGPLTGGALAGVVYENVFAVNASLEKAMACLLHSKFDGDEYGVTNVEHTVHHVTSETSVEAGAKNQNLRVAVV